MLQIFVPFLFEYFKVFSFEGTFFTIRKSEYRLKFKKGSFWTCEMTKLHYFQTASKESLVFDHPHMEKFWDNFPDQSKY